MWPGAPRPAARTPSAASLPAGQRIGPLDELVGLAPGLPAEEAGRRTDAWLDGAYGGTRLADRAYRLSLLEKRAADLSRERDSLLEVARALAPLDAAIRGEQKARDGARSRFGPAYAGALVEKAGGLVAPDANSTLRVTFGTVKGVSPRDGLLYAPQTRLAGILESTGPATRSSRCRPPCWRRSGRSRAGARGPWRDAALGDNNRHP